MGVVSAEPPEHVEFFNAEFAVLDVGNNWELRVTVTGLGRVDDSSWKPRIIYVP